MGFNNGYDSGYSDCEAENRKRWEREAVERYKAENPPSGGGQSVDLASFPRVIRANGSSVGELAAGSVTVDNVILMYMGNPNELFGNIDTTISQLDTHSYDLAFTDNFPDGQLFCVYVTFSGQPTALSFVVNGDDCGAQSVSSITENGGVSCVAWFQKQTGAWKFLSFQPVA